MEYTDFAIMIIYPDGKVEAIPIEEGLFGHTKYYKKLVNQSERFNRICGTCDFSKGIHFHIDNLLAKNGAIIFQNWNIREINTCRELGEKYLETPEFLVCFPKEFASDEQLAIFEKITKNYPKSKLVYFKYINDELSFTDSYSNDDLKEEIEEFKNETERRN